MNNKETVNAFDNDQLLGVVNSKIKTSLIGLATVTALGADIATHATLLTGIHGLAITAGKTLTVQDNVTISGPLGTGAYATIANYAPLASPTFTGVVSESNNANGDQIGMALTNPYSDASASISLDLMRGPEIMARLIGYLGQPSNNGGAFKIQVRDGNAGVMVTPVSIVVNPNDGISVINLSASTVTGLKLSGGIDVNGTTWTNSGGAWTIPAVTLGGSLNANNQRISGISEFSVDGTVVLGYIYSTDTVDPHVTGRVWRSGNSLMISTG